MFGPAPERLVGDDGTPAFGVFGEAIRLINLTDFDYRRVAPFPFSLTRASARIAVKRWQYLGVITDDIAAGLAVADVGYAANAFAYVALRGEPQVREFSFLDPAGRCSRYSASSVEGVTEYLRGNVEIRLDNRLVDGPRKAVLRVPGVELDAEFDERGITPLCAVTQNGLRGFNYCHKAAALPVTGRLRVDGREFDLGERHALGVLDWTAGCAAHYTFWNWACGSGYLPDGRTVGCNFVSGINERGFTENVFWVGGKPVKVDTMFFRYDPADVLKPWRITSSDARVDLEFFPENERAENLNLGVMMSRFHQPFGEFRGTFVIDGVKTPVTMRGYVEEHEAKW